MPHDFIETSRVAIRARKAIRRSTELIRSTHALIAQNQAFLSRLDMMDLLGNQPTTSQSPHAWSTPDLLLQWVMHSALEITRTGMANIQLFERGSGSLHIAAQCGFNRAFLEYFECVRGRESACGEALHNHARVLVEDVTKSPIFRGTPALEVLLDAGVRAVQSTPISRFGSLVGMLSTHWSSPRCPNEEELLQLDVLAHTAANWLERTN